MWLRTLTAVLHAASQAAIPQMKRSIALSAIVTL